MKRFLTLFLHEQESKRSSADLCGRNDGFVKVIFPKSEIAVGSGQSTTRMIQKGDYVAVQVWNC